MSNRVVLGALPGGGYGLRVSLPGQNVLDAGLDQALRSFDSAWGAAARVHATGTVSIASATGDPSYVTVNFGVTFPSLPTVIAFKKTASNTYETFGDVWHAEFQLPDQWWGNYPPGNQRAVRVYTNKVEFLRNYGSATVSYIILRPLP